MNPILPLIPGLLKYTAGPLPWMLSSGSRSGHSSIRRRSTSSFDMPSSASATPTGISSMKRTSMPNLNARPAISVSSSSLKPFCGSVLTFVFMPDSAESSMERRVFSSLPPPVIYVKRSASMVSRLMFMPSTPISRSSSIYLSSVCPLVVTVTSSIPSIALISRMRSVHPSLTKGSPPVIFMRLIPSSAAALHMRTICSYVRIRLMDTFSHPSGMQYLHLRSHLSVIETRMYSILRPYLSTIR